MTPTSAPTRTEAPTSAAGTPSTSAPTAGETPSSAPTKTPSSAAPTPAPSTAVLVPGGGPGNATETSQDPAEENGTCPEGSYDTDGDCFFVWDRNGSGRAFVYVICVCMFVPTLVALGSLGWMGLDISLDVVASTGDVMTDIFYLTQEPYFNGLLFGLSCASMSLTVLPYMLWLARNPVRLHLGSAVLIRTERTLAVAVGGVVWWTVGLVLYAMKVLPFGRIKRAFLLDPESGVLCGKAHGWLERINTRIRGRPQSPVPRSRADLDPPFDPAAYNRMRLFEVAVESVPQFTVQLVNGLLLNSWSVASALSLAFSGFLILRVLQQLLVYVGVVGRSPDEMPVGLGLFVEPVCAASVALQERARQAGTPLSTRRKTKRNKSVLPRQRKDPDDPSEQPTAETASPARDLSYEAPTSPTAESETQVTQV